MHQVELIPDDPACDTKGRRSRILLRVVADTNSGHSRGAISTKLPAHSTARLQQNYYLENFNTLVRFVSSRYQALLVSEEIQFIALYENLSTNAQQLYVRLVSRTPDYFRLSKLNYPDIRLDEAIDELHQAQLIQLDIASLEHCLPLFTNRELSTTLRTTATRTTAIRTAAKNNELESAHWATPDLFGDSPASRLIESDRVIEIKYKQAITTFRLLFFGNLYEDLSSFVLRDLGYRRFESYAIESGSPLFNHRALIEAHLAYYQCVECFDAACESGVDALTELHDSLPEIPKTSNHQSDRALRRRLDKLRNKIARQLEREEALTQAAYIYHLSSYPPARERLTRIMAKAGQTEEALDLCRDILSAPIDSEEQDFAQSFGQRLAGKLQQQFPSAPKHRPPELLLNLQKSRLSVEFSVATHFAKDGKCYYLENNLINSIFGLAFWDIIFAPVNDVFFHPFQSEPADFREPDFIHCRETVIQKRLAEISAGRLHRIVRSHLYHKHGLSNPMVNWRYCRNHILELALKRIPVDAWLAIFEQLLTDIRNFRSGQPDLIYFPDEGGYRFIEVKAPGDKLQKNQLRWMDCFNRNDIPHLVINVEWSDPTTHAG